ncbi:MAG: hypothetical protein WCB63_08055, partial [Polyangiales bacterium]
DKRQCMGASDVVHDPAARPGRAGSMRARVWAMAESLSADQTPKRTWRGRSTTRRPTPTSEPPR